jgi:hypothetical protein
MNADNYIYVDESGPAIAVYAASGEVPARVFVVGEENRQYEQDQVFEDIHDARRYAERYAAALATTLGCDWGTNY